MEGKKKENGTGNERGKKGNTTQLGKKEKKRGKYEEKKIKSDKDVSEKM